MSEQEKVHPTEELKRKLVATNALITDEEIKELKSQVNAAIVIETLRVGAPIDDPDNRMTAKHSRVLSLKDVGVFVNEKTNKKYLIYLLGNDGYRYPTLIKRIKEGVALEVTLKAVRVVEGLETEDATLWMSMRQPA